MDDLILRQAAIDALAAYMPASTTADGSALVDHDIFVAQETYVDCIQIIDELPSAQPETCEGCRHLGKWENEVEYGYPSPCTCCKRRVEDCYEK